MEFLTPRCRRYSSRSIAWNRTGTGILGEAVSGWQLPNEQSCFIVVPSWLQMLLLASESKFVFLDLDEIPTPDTSTLLHKSHRFNVFTVPYCLCAESVSLRFRPVQGPVLEQMTHVFGKT